MAQDLGPTPRNATIAGTALDVPSEVLRRWTLGDGGEPGKRPPERLQGDRASACEPATGSESGPLPCPLKNHISTEHSFPGSARRTAFALQINVSALIEEVGLERVGFLTLTFADHVLDPHEAQRRLNSLTTHVLRPRYTRCLRVYERQKSGRIHYHLLVALGSDIRTGCDFRAFENRDYRSAPLALRSEWAYWRTTAKKFGFGRTELLPVFSSSDAMGRYVGKYIGKHFVARDHRDRNVRLVSYVGPRTASTRFAWATGNARDLRARTRGFVTMCYEAGAIDECSVAGMRRRWGPRWFFRFKENIFAWPIEETVKKNEEPDLRRVQ